MAVTEKCIMAVQRYLETRSDEAKPLFLSQKKRRISRNQITRLVKNYAVMADLRTYKKDGVTKTRVSSHMLRQAIERKDEEIKDKSAE